MCKHFQHKVRIWIIVEKSIGNHLMGNDDDNPMSKGIKYVDTIKLNINQVIESV